MPDETLIEGLFRADSGLDASQPVDMEPMLNELEKTRNANFEKVLRKIGKKVPKKLMQFRWRRRELMQLTCTVTAVNAATDSYITVDHFERIHRDTLLENTRTHELMINNEDAAVAPNTTVEIRSYSHTTPGTAELAYATAVGDIITILPEAHAEGEDAPEAFRTQDTEAYDYIMQTARRGAEITDIAMNEAEYDPRGQRANDNRIALIEFMRMMNLLFYLSQSTREILSASPARRHTLGGIRQKIVTNRMSFAAVPPGLTPQAIAEILRTTIYQGAASDEKIAMVGQNATAAMSSWPEGSVRISPLEKDWGYNITRILTPHGFLNLSYDPMLSEEFGLADVMAMLDPAHIRQVYLRNMGLQILKKVPNLSTSFKVVDIIKGTYGLQMKFEELFAWLEDIT